MEEPIQKFPKVRHRHYAAWMLMVLLAVAAGAGWWMYKDAQQRVEGMQEEVATLRKENKELAAKPVPETASPLWAAAVNKAPLCGEWITSVNYKVPDAPALEALGLGDLMAEGYAILDVCADIGDGRLAFLGAKAGEKEMDLFGTADLKTGRLFYKRSSIRLDLTGAAPNFCRIDGVVAGKTAAEDRLLVYCGSEKAGGLTAWYAYDIKDDKLILAQEYTGVENNEYTVREGAILEQFHIRRRP